MYDFHLSNININLIFAIILSNAHSNITYVKILGVKSSIGESNVQDLLETITIRKN